MKVIAKGKGSSLIIEVSKNDLKLISDEDKDFEIGDELAISSLLTVVHQLSRKKNNYVPILEELKTTLEAL